MVNARLFTSEDHAFAGYPNIMSQTRKEEMTLYEAASMAQKEIESFRRDGAAGVLKGRTVEGRSGEEGNALSSINGKPSRIRRALAVTLVATGALLSKTRKDDECFTLPEHPENP